MAQDALNLIEISRVAKAELEQERYWEAVEARKAVLRERAVRPLWRRLFPFTITITRN